jgi:hypothetical protein
MLSAMNFEDAYNENFTLAGMVYLLRNSFKERLTHKIVLEETTMRPNTDPSSGFCMISSYLIYSLTGGDKIWEIHGTNLHWWLYHKQSSTIFDITHSQFSKKDLRGIYGQGCTVDKLKTDPMFYDILKTKAHALAQRAGIE